MRTKIHVLRKANKILIHVVKHVCILVTVDNGMGNGEKVPDFVHRNNSFRVLNAIDHTCASRDSSIVIDSRTRDAGMKHLLYARNV